MARGGVYFHSQFPFHDGSVGEKRFVVLNNPEKDEPYLVVKTTSNLRNRTYQRGCNPNTGVFFLPAGAETTFPKDTLIQLPEIYEFSSSEFLKGHLTEKVISYIGDLSSLTASQIVNCIRKLKDDIDQQYFAMITR
ncbi:MAG: hypothetical protein HY707_07580 [Ignavibacteriae bacterium]|nr:hypothetical protein [Ignavibacteriota bacterium]